MSISLQEIEQNLAVMPEKDRVLAEEVLDSLTEEELRILFAVFNVDEEAAIEEDMPIDEEPLLEEETLAPVAEPTMEEAMAERPPPMAAPIQDEMQALAFGDVVDPAAAQQMAVPPEMARDEAPFDPDAMAAELQGEYDGLNGPSDLDEEMAGLIQQEGASETGVADDVVVDEAKAGDYIINAAAVKRVGVQDLEERILEPAIERLNKKGIDITLASLKSPSDQIQNVDDSENVDIAVSNNEYYIPEVLAGEIGYDLLDKINKRGEKETEEKLAEEAVPAEAAPVEEEVPPEAPAEQAMLQGFNSGGEVQQDMLARILIAEAGQEGEEGMQVVANVVNNRIIDRKTNFKTQKTFKDVISAKLPSGSGYEFTGYNNNNYKNAHNHPQWKKAIKVAKRQISGKLPDITDGATFYRNKNLKSKRGSNPRGQKFFDDRVKSGRFIIQGTVGGHTIYLDTDSTPFDRGAGRTSEPLTTEVTGSTKQKPTTPTTQDQSFMNRDIEETSSIRPLGTEPITGEDRGQLSLRDARDISKINEGIGTSA